MLAGRTKTASSSSNSQMLVHSEKCLVNDRDCQAAPVNMNSASSTLDTSNNATELVASSRGVTRQQQRNLLVTKQQDLCFLRNNRT